MPKHAVSTLAKQIAKGGDIETLPLAVHSEILESASAAAKDGFRALIDQVTDPEALPHSGRPSVVSTPHPAHRYRNRDVG